MSIQSEINRISGAKSDIADAIEAQGVTVPSGTKLDGMANLIGQISGGSGKLNSTQAADAYDPTATYAVGDKVSYAGNVYSCISAISTPEAWDSTHWDQVDPIQDQVDDVRNTLTQLETNVGKILPVITGSTNNSGYTIRAGDYFEANGALYKANQAIPTTGEWASSSTAVNKTALQEVNQPFYVGSLTFDGTGFPAQYAPRNNTPFPVIARNQQTGAIYILWYRSASSDFRISATLSGDAPVSGNYVYMFYPI